MDNTELYVWSGACASITGQYRLPQDLLNDQLPIYGFAYTPSDCRFFEIDADGIPRYSDGGELDLDQAYEMRIFCNAWEMRWRRNGHGARLAVISDVPLNRCAFIASADDGLIEPLSVLSQTGRYLLWGELADAENKYLTTKEYFKKGEYGNWVFHTERLTGFAPAREILQSEKKQGKAA